MNKAKTAIVGGGLSGLYAAYLLDQIGARDWVLFEARGVVGGRILSFPTSVDGADGRIDASCMNNQFDLGPSWFWPAYQRELDVLVQSLGLERFEQHEAGDAVVERTGNGSLLIVTGHKSEPPSMRLKGGTAALINALVSRLDAARVLQGHRVRGIRRVESHVTVDVDTTTGNVSTWEAEHVLLAMPPRLIEETISFTPHLPTELANQWRNTATWMAPHAKYLAVYDRPFWRDEGMSGEARSGIGPLVEIHDASGPDGCGALFGFFGISVHERQGIPESVLRSHCRAQMARLFGAQAGKPKIDIVKDWAMDPFTSTSADSLGASSHHSAPVSTVSSGPWQGRITGIGSEWSRQFPGYLAGAIDAASAGVNTLTTPF